MCSTCKSTELESIVKELDREKMRLVKVLFKGEGKQLEISEEPCLK